MNVSSSTVPATDKGGVNFSSNTLIIVVAVLLCGAAIFILAGVLYMVLRTAKKRAVDIKPRYLIKEEKLRKIRLSLAFGDLEPKVKRELVTMRTNHYDFTSSSFMDGSTVKTLPLKCTL